MNREDVIIGTVVFYFLTSIVLFQAGQISIPVVVSVFYFIGTGALVASFPTDKRMKNEEEKKESNK